MDKTALAENIVFTLAFLAIAFGFWLIWAPLGYIMAGAMVFGLMVLARLRGDPPNRKPPGRNG